MIVLDRGQDPGATAALRAAQEAGAGGWLAYVGGRSLIFPPWSAQTVRDLVASLGQVLPVYALATPLSAIQGDADGREALQLVSNWGVFDQIMLDVESVFFRANPSATLSYIAAWTAHIHGASTRACIYGTPDVISALPATGINPDTVLVANYPFPGQKWGPPDPAHIPGLDDGFFVGRRGWQYTNEVAFAGIRVDISTVQFPLLGGLGGPDDMFTDQDRTLLESVVISLAAKQSPLLVPAGKAVWVSGPGKDTQWNICAQVLDTTVQVIAYDPNDGHVIGSAGPKTVLANLPDRRGPIPFTGTGAGVGATGPCTLGFHNQGPGDVLVMLH